MSGVKIATLDRLIAGDRHDPILIVGKAIGLEWATVRALILLRLGPSRVPSPADIENLRVNFARLMPSTAERVVNFWQTSQSAVNGDARWCREDFAERNDDPRPRGLC